MKAVSNELKILLSELFGVKQVQQYCYLAGGTNLAIKYDHRVSTDIDLFVLNGDFFEEIKNEISTLFREGIKVLSSTKRVFRAIINEIKVDVLFWQEIKEMLYDIEVRDNNWKFCHDLDIAAMKIQSIVNRGSRKDFYDLSLLMTKYSLTTMIASYLQKYQIESDNQVVRYLSDFHEAELESEQAIKVLNHPYPNWEDTKQRIVDELSNYLQPKKDY